MNELEGMINSVLSNPDEMKKIMEVASSLFGGQQSETAPEAEVLETEAPMPDIGSIISGLSKMPPGIFSAAKKLLGGGLGSLGAGGGGLGAGADKTALLEAMKPWLSEKRRSKLERSMKIARVMHIAGAAFLKKGG